MSRRLRATALTRICATNARGAYYLGARVRKLVPDSVDSSTSGCWSLEGAARSWEVAAAGKSSASTPNASKERVRRPAAATRVGPVSDVHKNRDEEA